MVIRHQLRTQAYYSDYDVDGNDAEVSSFFSETPVNDAYSASFPRDPYAAFDPDVSATSEDDNHESTVSGSNQRGFKKIGEQWGAMVTSHLKDRGNSQKDGRSRYSEENSGQRDASSRHNRRRDRGGWRRPAAVRSPSEPSPEISVQDQAVGTTPRVVHLVSEEVQTAAEDARILTPEVEGARISTPGVDENCTASDNAVLHSIATTKTEMVDREVQCVPRTSDLLKKEYMRLPLLCDWSW